ncbi:MAG TPA: hypothetical protein VFG34_04685 [Sphingopyxis sp.]|nr:hypothetical protein [Sphingopyxis sp.]
MAMKWTDRISRAALGALIIASVPGAALAQAPSDAQSGTARLNAEQVARAKAEEADYAARVKAAEDSVARNQAEFEAQTAAYEKAKAEAATRATEIRMRWEADVRACKNGDRSRCDAPGRGSAGE